MEKIKPLPYQLYRRKLPFAELSFKSTNELKILKDYIGQERALTALNLGIGIKNQGYNLYAMGPTGIGKFSLITNVLKDKAKSKNTPSDWCYIHNFEDPEKPIALQLPPGMGVLLKNDIKTMIIKLSTHILSVFESDQYRHDMHEIAKDFNMKHKHISILNQENKNTLITELYKRRHMKEKRLQTKITASVVKPIVRKIKKKYLLYKPVIKYLKSIETDIILHVDEFIRHDESTNLISFVMEDQHLIQYQVNVLVDNSKKNNAPVIFEDNPTYANLICRVEYMAQLGTATTQFTLIKPGSLHLANGGYLIIEASKLKKQKEAWDALKRALYTKKIAIDPIDSHIDSFRPISLQPMPIPLNIKIILLGTRNTYYYFVHHDADFMELFKIIVDFDDTTKRTKRNIHLYARLIATIVRKENLRQFNSKAVAEIIEHSSRIAEDNEKLSTHIRSIYDLIIESDYAAQMQKRKIVTGIDVKKAIIAQIHRLDRIREMYYEDIFRNFVHIDIKGKVVGQVNCISVIQGARFSFGHPLRVTATVRSGRAKLIDIQREIKMAGPMHSKAGLTIMNFLGARFGRNLLISLCASLSFEQVYGAVDGDSASVGEVAALLSALANIPLKQSLAVTGSVDQHGRVQTVGGINEKIEGFYDICNYKNLTGKQGVIIPMMNVKNLMLKEEVAHAAKLNKFAIYPIQTIDEALILLFDLPGVEDSKKIAIIDKKIEIELKKFNAQRMQNRIKK